MLDFFNGLGIGYGSWTGSGFHTQALDTDLVVLFGHLCVKGGNLEWSFSTFVYFPFDSWFSF